MQPQRNFVKKKIFIVDDHPIFRGGLAQLINQEDDLIVCGEAAEAKEALQKISKAKPDLAIVDISLQGTNGIDLTKTILAKHPNVLALVVSMYEESLYLERALRAGAKGYLTKQGAAEHAVVAIRKVLGGDVYISEQWKDKLLHRFVGGGTIIADVSSGVLSDREMEVLQFLGQGYSTKKIAEELFVSGKTIESHYAHIKEKMNLKNSHELMQYAVKWSLTEK
jgi:DNA-binding NarL/FixJ family response regulator